MEFTDLPMTLTVLVVLTAAAVVVWFDYLRKKHRQQQPQRIRLVTQTAPPQRSISLFPSLTARLRPGQEAGRGTPAGTAGRRCNRFPASRAVTDRTRDRHRRNGAALSRGAIRLDGTFRRSRFRRLRLTRRFGNA